MNKVLIKFLGSGDAFGSGGRLQTCIFVQSGDTGFLLDYQTLLDHRSDLSCKRIIVTHMSQDMLDRLDNLELEYAEDGKIIEL